MVLTQDNLHSQVRALLEVVSGGAYESVDSPLADISRTVLEGQAELSSVDMIIRGLDSTMIILSGKGLLIRNND